MVEPNRVDIPFSGTRVLHAGKTRLFEPVHKILVIADAVGLAYMAVVAVRIEANPAENYATATCKQFPIRVCYPVLEPTLSLVRQEPLTRIPITFTPLELVGMPPGKVQVTV